MSDIVERLLDLQTAVLPLERRFIIKEAADEIERLRAALGPAICKRVFTILRRHDCWIADTSQWPPRTRMKVQVSVTSSGPPCSPRPLSRSTI
jgi:hypothetical protein